MTLFRAGQDMQLEASFEQMQSEGIPVQRLTQAQAQSMVPVLPEGRFVAALLDPTGFDMDVHAIHQGYLRGFKQSGGRLVTQARVKQIRRIESGWQVSDEKGRQWSAHVIVNAAGAWADQVAQMAGVQPLGLQPKRRSAWTFQPPVGLDIRGWPLVLSSEENWYIKPDAGVLLGSPANADPVPPQDVQPEIEDIAAGIERIEQDLSLTVGRPIRTWAGLRTFSPHGEMVGGYDPDQPDFFWVVGQGGYGIQTSAAMGRACANLVLRESLDPDLVSCGVRADVLQPSR
jgi:D-arginine dehydrogenase